LETAAGVKRYDPGGESIEPRSMFQNGDVHSPWDRDATGFFAEPAMSLLLQKL
jgi:hypothetical protein